MRGTVPGLPTPYRMAELLPAVYQEEDPFIQRFTGGLDDVLAPLNALEFSAEEGLRVPRVQALFIRHARSPI